MTAKPLLLPEPPEIPGISFHNYQSEKDLENILLVCNRLYELGIHEGGLELDELKNDYAHLNNCDLARDFLSVSYHNQPAGYIRRYWENLIAEETRVHINILWMLPEWMDSPVGDYLISWVEARASQTSADLPPLTGGNRIEFLAPETDKAKLKLLERHGYRPLRYYFDMSRSLEGELPDHPLPPGLEVRPALSSQLRQIWDASIEAFKDEWGSTELTDENYAQFLNDKTNHPELWQVAWEGDQIAGMVMNYINLTQNEQERRFRGYTEGISVRRPWRGRGLASALICRSMRMFKALNMTEVALSVDAENPSGALGLYTRLGYQTYLTKINYAKNLPEAS